MFRTAKSRVTERRNLPLAGRPRLSRTRSGMMPGMSSRSWMSLLKKYPYAAAPKRSSGFGTPDCDGAHHVGSVVVTDLADVLNLQDAQVCHAPRIEHADLGAQRTGCLDGDPRDDLGRRHPQPPSC